MSTHASFCRRWSFRHTAPHAGDDRSAIRKSVDVDRWRGLIAHPPPFDVDVPHVTAGENIGRASAVQ